MKKLFSVIAAIIILSCSTSSDDNGNSTTTVVPVPPTNLTGIVASPTQINLSWTDNSTNETGFKIQRRTGSENYTVVGTVNEDAFTFSDSGLLPSTTYIYRVYSYNTVGNSPTYSNEVTVTTLSGINIIGPNVTDIDGNVYASVTNCDQTWMKQNLNVSKYSDGTPILEVTDPTAWANLTTGAWCYYENNTANGPIYGKLYNWYAVAGIYDAASAANPALRKKLAPTGWHIPSDVEWSSLINCLDPNANGGNISPNMAGGKMKATGTLQAGTGLWETPNEGASNASGFTGLPAGSRFEGGTFGGIGNYGGWLSSSETNATNAWGYGLYYDDGFASRGNAVKKVGFSVRCLRD
jgi:uncharacterized protein (TIGR02145 family)